jgi:hypothetical protein
VNESIFVDRSVSRAIKKPANSQSLKGIRNIESTRIETNRNNHATVSSPHHNTNAVHTHDRPCERQRSSTPGAKLGNVLSFRHSYCALSDLPELAPTNDSAPLCFARIADFPLHSTLSDLTELAPNINSTPLHSVLRDDSRYLCTFLSGATELPSNIDSAPLYLASGSRVSATLYSV